MPATYTWKITKDHIADTTRPEGTNDNATGLMGPSDGDPNLKTNPVSFSMYDDDKVLYYEGMLYGNYDGFEPLEDFGTPNAGAVHIKIDGEWL